MRQPIANKTHYANGVTLLEKQFHELFMDEKGPGDLPIKKKEAPVQPVKGIIVPHAPLPLAGPCASWAYKSLVEEGEDTTLYIIVAQAQNSLEAGVTQETFDLPSGEMRTDQTFIRELVAKGHINYNNNVHFTENVIEVQLPFLQFINKPHSEKVKFVPLIVNNKTDVKELCLDIKETLVEQKKTASFIFVTNFTSYGRAFQYVPFTEHIPENIAALDKPLLDALKQGDQDTFFSAVQEHMVPISGYDVMRFYFSLFASHKATLEQYYLSGDVNTNYLNTVSYASLVIR